MGRSTLYSKPFSWCSNPSLRVNTRFVRPRQGDEKRRIWVYYFADADSGGSDVVIASFSRSKWREHAKQGLRDGTRLRARQGVSAALRCRDELGPVSDGGGSNRGGADAGQE
jgi:hypothetical protein